jgi:hypothetical protein
VACGPRIPLSCGPDASDIAHEWDNKNDACGGRLKASPVKLGLSASARGPRERTA